MHHPTDEHAGKEPPSFLEARSLKRALLEELRSSWQEGKSARAEDLLPRWPADPGDDPDVASLLFEEYRQRLERSTAPGEAPRREEYEQRFPSQKGSLASLFHHHGILRSVGGASGASGIPLALPAVGDELFGFRLRQELGRGAFAKVYLAEQAELAGRPVVVKVSAIEGDEPQTLAQLQHTHIVPIYSVHEDSRAGIRAVCMPYFGGASLSRVLQAAWNESTLPSQGQELAQALDGVGSPWGDSRIEDRGSKIEDRAAGPANPRPGLCPPRDPRSAILDPQSSNPWAELNYTQAVVWIIARLAEGLQHAHDRGVLHCDIKPSNVLLGADGQPMLLDFNLAQQLSTGNGQAQATLGGTVAYMAPEHLRALATRDPALVRQVDGRSDLYGLGMVLFEMLTNQRPFDQSGSYAPIPALIEAMAVERSRHIPSLRSKRAGVPWSLESITRKCLAPEPSQRYQRAADLAEDLQRFLDDRPLRFAPELSYRERARKWVRRHPRLAASGSVSAAALVLLTVAATILGGVRADLRAAQARADAARGAQVRQRQQDFEAGTLRALCLVNTSADLQDHAEQGLRACEQTLNLYGVLDREGWQSHADWQGLAAAERKHLAEDVRELLLLLARARVQTAARTVLGKDRKELTRTATAFLAPLAGTGARLTGLTAWAAGQARWGPRSQPLRRAHTRALRQALALLERAEALPGLPKSRALLEERAYFQERLGDVKAAAKARRQARSLPAADARDHYLLAATYAGGGRYTEAVTELNQALAKNPRHYWSLFQRGICYQEKGEFALALADFSACTALWPEFAWGHFNRGRILHQVGKIEEAQDEYSEALKHDPELVCAYLNRGLLLLDLTRYQPALADFDAAARGLDSVVLHGGRGLALEHLGRFREADAAFARAWERDPDNIPMLVGYGFAVAERQPDKARTAFQKVLAREPRNPRALYGRGMLFSNKSAQSAQALAFFNQALNADPTFVDARRARALVLAQRGEGDWARQDIDWCVASDPSGVTLYAAACVYALGADKTDSPSGAQWMADRAVALLKEAFARGYGNEKAAKDTDLKAIWRHPEFLKMTR
jgi:serine/threonine protein kinase/lipoprotein NlpI